MKKIILFVLFSLFIQGCATQKTLQFLEGSRVDGVVTLGFDYNELEVPQWNKNQGLQQSERICKGWGYKGASELSNDEECNHTSQSSHRIGDVILNLDECTNARLMVKYQCTSQSNEIANKPVQPNNYQPPVSASSYQQMPATQVQSVQPVAEQNTVTPAQPVVEQAVPTYQQPQSGQSETDLTYCLNLMDNKAIVECVRKAKK